MLLVNSSWHRIRTKSTTLAGAGGLIQPRIAARTGNQAMPPR
jgi:hypothetical protein